MRKRSLKTEKLPATARKILEITDFSGLSRRSAETGSLLEAEGIRLLSEGTLASVLGRVQVSVPDSTLQPGVYTLYDHYDSVYETQTTADFIYRNICPAEIMAYSDAEIIAARVLVGENLLPGKTADGYRNLLGAFADSSAFYIFYDAVVNIIDHRRADSYEAVGSGIVVQFESLKSTTSTYAYTVHQLWLDVITPGKGVTSQMIGAQRTQLFSVSASRERATLVSEDKTTYRYVSAEYTPDLGASYSIRMDAIYTAEYEKLNGRTPQYAPYAAGMTVARYRRPLTSIGGQPVAARTYSLILPTMQLLSESEGAVSVEEPLVGIPQMEQAVQHFGRLFGICGTEIYASKDGDCTDFTLPAAGSADTAAAWTASAPGGEGAFTALASFDGKVAAFTEKSMLVVEGNALPFTLSYVGAFGCQSQAALAAAGAYLYFVSDTGVMRYNGTSVKPVGSGLMPGSFAGASLAAADDTLLLCLPGSKTIYLYDLVSEMWSTRRAHFSEMLLFGAEKMAALVARDTENWQLSLVSGGAAQYAFSLLLDFPQRRRVYRISVTAELAAGATLSAAREDGSVLFSAAGTDGVLRAYSFAPRNLYLESDVLRFFGVGLVKIHTLRLEYAEVENTFGRYGIC